MRLTTKDAILAVLVETIIRSVYAIVRQLKIGEFVIMTPTGKWSPKMIDRTFQEMGVRRKGFNIPPTKRPVKR